MTQTSCAELARRLGGAIAKRSLLDHPFYQAWVAGELGLDDLAVYSRQYWRQVQAFPAHLESLSHRVPETVRMVLQQNLRDELEGEHLRLWRDFARSVGASDLDKAAVNGATRQCVAVFETAADEAPVPFALGMIYGYESQTPKVAATKASGLRTHHGLEDEALAYFDVHAELDVEHSSQLLACLAEVTGSERDLIQAELGASLGASAVWLLLDGVWAELTHTVSGDSAN